MCRSVTCVVIEMDCGNVLISKWISNGYGRPMANLISTSGNNVSYPLVYEYV